jgi:arylsulfatase A-like enzyme
MTAANKPKFTRHHMILIGLIAVAAIAAIIFIVVPMVTSQYSDSTLETNNETEAYKPNVLIIVSDDVPHYALDYTPTIKSEILGKGVTFTDAHVTTSQCCPSRASILTGLYAHNHGVVTNKHNLTIQTFFDNIDANLPEYRTAMIGKYLNSWDGSCRPEFDYWVAFGSEFATPARNPWYDNGELNVNCTWKSYTGAYSTYLLRDYALEFLDKSLADGKPYVMLFAPKNGHSPATPAPEDLNLYPTGLPSYYQPPSLNENDVSDKPTWLQELPLLTYSDIEFEKEEQLRLARTLASLDRSVKSLLDFLESKGQLSKTLIIYVSDNGIFHGEHRIPSGKGAPYDESMRVSMGARWDRHVPVGFIDKLVANIDIAPTIYEVLGLTPPYLLDGQSLLDLYRDEKPWRDVIMTEQWAQGRLVASVITKNWTYTETKLDKFELYDRNNDPYELDNLWCGDPCPYSDVISELALQLHQLRPSWDREPLFNQNIRDD